MNRPKRTPQGRHSWIVLNNDYIKLAKYATQLEQERDSTLTKMENGIQELKEALKEK